MLETFVLQELRRQASWQQAPLGFFHFRDRDDFEVDIVLEHGYSAVAGVEVKAAATASEADFRGLRKLRDAAGKCFVAGVVLYDGSATVDYPRWPVRGSLAKALGSAMTATFTESVVEQAALGWLEGVGWQVRHGAEIAPGEPGAERGDYRQVILEQRLRDALALLNPALPAGALEDAFRKLTRPQGAEPVARNRAVHRLLVDGVTVEYRTAEGEIRGAQARVIDFDDSENNDWLAVNQFSVAENKHSRRLDVVLFVNGLPLAVLELKNAADEDATI